MISESQLLALLTDIETSQVEHTVSLGNTNKFCQAVCAFSNDFNRSGKPGYLFVGAMTPDAPSAQKFTAQMLSDLAVKSGSELVLAALWRPSTRKQC